MLRSYEPVLFFWWYGFNRKLVQRISYFSFYFLLVCCFLAFTFWYLFFHSCNCHNSFLFNSKPSRFPLRSRSRVVTTRNNRKFVLKLTACNTNTLTTKNAACTALQETYWGGNYFSWIESQRLLLMSIIFLWLFYSWSCVGDHTTEQIPLT